MIPVGSTSHDDDPLPIPTGPVTRARAKAIQDSYLGLVRQVLARPWTVENGPDQLLHNWNWCCFVRSFLEAFPVRDTKFSPCVVGFIEDRADPAASNAGDLSPAGQRVDKANISRQFSPLASSLGREGWGLELVNLVSYAACGL
ncbi:hypothetical protein Droror1_Dr00027352, partial [Drosera rotundifolia]